MAAALAAPAAARAADEAQTPAAETVAPPKAAAVTPLVVLELFTSQGCSSCPPADEVLGRLAPREDLMALTLPVDYWDYLGWKDTLAHPSHGARQRAYAKARGDFQVYTPQLVVDGAHHVNGADEPAIERLIAKAQRSLVERSVPRVPLSLAVDGDTLIVEVGAAPEGLVKNKGVVWLALITAHAKVKVLRGENRDKKLAYFNVVRELMPVGRWYGEPITLKLPLCRQVRSDIDSCAVLLQQGMSGPILAASHQTWK